MSRRCRWQGIAVVCSPTRPRASHTLVCTQVRRTDCNCEVRGRRARDQTRSSAATAPRRATLRARCRKWRRSETLRKRRRNRTRPSVGGAGRSRTRTRTETEGRDEDRGIDKEDPVLEVREIQFIGSVMDTPVVKPTVPSFQKTLKIPQTQVLDKCWMWLLSWCS